MKRTMLAILLAAMTVLLCSCGGSSGSSKGYGGYDMPNSGDESIVDYIQRVDPDLWDSMEDSWGN